MSQLLKSFDDAPDTAVITTVYVVRQASPITFVAHYEDSYWQFSGGEGEEAGLPDEAFLVLRLDEIVALDASVREVADLPKGAAATRAVRGGEWGICLVLK